MVSNVTWAMAIIKMMLETTVPKAAMITPQTRNGLAAFQNFFSCSRTWPPTQSAANANGKPITGISPSNPSTKHRMELLSTLIYISGMEGVAFI